LGQKIWLLIILSGAVISFFYFRKRYQEFLEWGKLFISLSLIFIAAGGWLVQMIHGSDILISCLLLKERLVSGKLILIGYIFLIISFLIYTEILFNSLIGKFRNIPNKHNGK